MGRLPRGLDRITQHPSRLRFPQPLRQRLGGSNVKRIAAGVVPPQRYQPAGEGLVAHGVKVEVQQPGMDVGVAEAIARAEAVEFDQYRLQRGLGQKRRRALDDIGLEPLDIEIQRQLIEIWLRQGRRSEAARRYEVLRTRTMREFGEEPGFSLADLAR